MAEARKGADKHRLPKRGHRHGILALLLLALGCAERGAVTIEEPPGAVVCRRGPQCDAKWQRALEWVRANSRWNVLEATDAVIRTEGPLDTLVPAFSGSSEVRTPAPRSSSSRRDAALTALA